MNSEYLPNLLSQSFFSSPNDNSRLIPPLGHSPYLLKWAWPDRPLADCVPAAETNCSSSTPYALFLYFFCDLWRSLMAILASDNSDPAACYIETLMNSCAPF